MGWWVNEFPKYLIFVIWIGINAGLFAKDYVAFDTQSKYVYSNFYFKEALPVARGSAEMLNFNCTLILLFVCRNLLSLVRDIPFLPHSIGRLMDKNITFHKMTAYMICFATALHLGAHVFNFERLIGSYEDRGDEETELVFSYLNGFKDTNTTTRLNPILKKGLDPVLELLQTVAGITGVVITLALIVMVSSSTELIRRSYFEVFWFTHHLFVVFFIGLLFHGFGELLRSQTNANNPDDPKNCVKDSSVCNTQVTPQFAAPGPKTWMWIVAPMFLYFMERCIRFYRSFQTCEVKKVVKHPSKVIEVQMRKPGFKAQAGQYIFLHCPSISPLEWHPFTLTSCPEEDFFSVHVRIAGDWTEALSKSCGDDTDNVDVSKIPRLACDGPFGTASTDVFRHETVICVGAGIGVTPFASILKSIWYRQQRKDSTLNIKKVYFYWICPDTNAFEWFSDLLQSLEQQMLEKGEMGFLEYNIYLTRGWGKGDARTFALHDGDEQDVITGLKQKNKFWTTELG